MPGDFQVICGSMVGENRRLLASSETPAQPPMKTSENVGLIWIKNLWTATFLISSQMLFLPIYVKLPKRQPNVSIFFSKTPQSGKNLQRVRLHLTL